MDRIMVEYLVEAVESELRKRGFVLYDVHSCKDDYHDCIIKVCIQKAHRYSFKVTFNNFNSIYGIVDWIVNRVCSMERRHLMNVTELHPTSYGKNTLITPDEKRYMFHDAAVTAKTFMDIRSKKTAARRFPEITNVIFNDPATIVFWSDDTKTVVKCQDGDLFDPEKGIAMAIAKKLYGNKGSYNDEIKKWTEKYYEQESNTPARFGSLDELINLFTSVGYVQPVVTSTIARPIEQAEEKSRGNVCRYSKVDE